MLRNSLIALAAAAALTPALLAPRLARVQTGEMHVKGVLCVPMGYVGSQRETIPVARERSTLAGEDGVEFACVSPRLSPAGGKLFRVPNPSAVEVTGIDGDAFQVRMADGRQGWVFAYWVAF